MGALVFGDLESAEPGGADPVVVALAVTVVALVAPAASRGPRRAADHAAGLFRDRRRSGAYPARFLYLGAMLGFFFFTTQFLQACSGSPPFQAGLGFLPMTS